MRRKEDALVITFAATADAMAAERFCIGQGLPGRIIPVPRQIHASCGLAWKTTPDLRTKFVQAFDAAEIRWAGMDIVALWI